MHREKMDGSRVSESLLCELSAQIRAIEDKERDHKKERKRADNGGVDYSWLVMQPSKSYSMSEMDRLELEGLCCRITPEESGRVIRSFRCALQFPHIPAASELPEILRTVIRQTIEVRPVGKSSGGVVASSSDWLSKSFASLRSLRRLRANAVSSLSDESETDVEMQSSVWCSSSSELRI